ncbi:MAG TPA: type II secretion system F family protein [Verrucomicrobiae bacterium]|nr:type II secretion system F family protein [Verrucomicrobiae bacterium]
MPTFQYKAKTRAGELVNGSLAAGDRRAALAELGKMGFFPLAVESAEAAPSGAKGARPLRGRIKSRDVLMFTQQLSSLLRSGMSLSQALGTLERRTQVKALATVLGELRGGIVQGESLSDALAKHPKTFSRFFVNLIKAGEASGSLDEVLLRLSKHQEQMAEVREKVIGALIYPLIIIGVGICTVTFFMLVMVPRFAMMFKEMGRTLPLPTRILIGVSDAFTSYWWIAVLLIVAGVTVYRIRARTPEGRLALDGLNLRLPVFGKIIMANALAQFARTLATLLENGVPVLTALQIVEDTMTNRVIANEIREARTRVTDGTSISQPLSKGKVFPPLLIDMLAVGEESGEVVPALKNIADTYESELSRMLKVFTTLLEPAIIIFMAMVVGAIVVSVLMAVFDITSGIGK